MKQTVEMPESQVLEKFTRLLKPKLVRKKLKISAKAP